MTDGAQESRIVSSPIRNRDRIVTSCPSTISRIRSPGCPSSPACICGSTRPARRSTSARRVRCGTVCAATWRPRAQSAGTTRCSTRSRALEVIVTDSVVEALALENNLIKQRSPEVQHPAPRRQELSVPAADDERGVSARAGGPPRGDGTATSTPGRSCRPSSRAGRWR